ncbi:MAG: hypothetical protein R3F61_35600 [Myxococcota bacterium]
MSDVGDLLDAADRMLDDPALTSGIWLRAASLVYRAALEEALSDFWVRRANGLQHANGRAQMACLREYAGEVLSREVSNAWGELSAMAHHRTELGPDPLAVRRAGQAVRAAVAGLMGTGGRNAS